MSEPIDGTCCACGYVGKEEIECPKNIGESCCNHWWNGTEEDNPCEN